MKLIESKECQPPIVEAIIMRTGQTGIVTASDMPGLNVGSVVISSRYGNLFNLDTSVHYVIVGDVRVQPHAPGTRLVFEAV